MLTAVYVDAQAQMLAARLTAYLDFAVSSSWMSLKERRHKQLQEVGLTLLPGSCSKSASQ